MGGSQKSKKDYHQQKSWWGVLELALMAGPSDMVGGPPPLGFGGGGPHPLKAGQETQKSKIKQ